MRKPLKWPDGSLDEHLATSEHLLETLELLADCAVQVRAVRHKPGKSRARTQEALSRRAGLYDDATNRLEKGSGWVDLSTLVRLLDAAGLRLQVVDKETGKPPVHD